MPIDTKRVKEIFLEAAEQSGPAAQAACLDRACGDDAELRERVEALLRSHDPAGSFLASPAVKPPEPHELATQGLGGAAPPDDPNAAEDLQFLGKPRRPDSLGCLGHYEVLQVLGKGGFGIVFRAFDDMLQRVVALKVMAPQMAATSPARRRFLREARSSAAIRHENVVQVYEVGEEPLPYLAMEFIPGETLQQRLDRTGPLGVLEVLRIGRQIAEGLAAAHACDLIHRDVKPGNVLLEGGSHKAKITDFGLARTADDASISQSGIIAGTPMFMAPEQALGNKIDQRADLFSFGSVLYQMTSGRPPFRAPSTLAVLKRVAEEQPRPIPEIIPETPDWLCGIIAKLHAKNPDKRFQSAREVADLLADCEAKLKAKQEVKNVLPAAVKPAGRKWVAAAAVALLPLIVLAVTEFAGVTQLFRGQWPTLAPKNPGAEPTPLADGWSQLFNGKDLAGWEAHPSLTASAWRVKDRTIVGAGEVSYLFYRGAEYDNFHLRTEFQINRSGNGGVYFRSPFPMADEGPHAKGYEAQIIGPDAPRSNYQTGSLIDFTDAKGTRIEADTWYTLEVVTDGTRIQIKLNGVTTTDVRDERNRFTRGHIALQLFEPGSAVRIRKIEIKVLGQTNAN